jgi:hypothetical protein
MISALANLHGLLVDLESEAFHSNLKQIPYKYIVVVDSYLYLPACTYHRHRKYISRRYQKHPQLRDQDRNFE